MNESKKINIKMYNVVTQNQSLTQKSNENLWVGTFPP